MKTEPVKKKKKKPEQTEPMKKKNRTANPGKERKKKVKSCCWYNLWVPYVCLITILPLSYELWKLKIVKMCFQFP